MSYQFKKINSIKDLEIGDIIIWKYCDFKVATVLEITNQSGKYNEGLIKCKYILGAGFNNSEWNISIEHNWKLDCKACCDTKLCIHIDFNKIETQLKTRGIE